MTAVSGGLRWWLLAYVQPGRVFRQLKSDPQKTAKAAWINLIFSLLYSVTPLVAYAVGIQPAIAPWMPIPAEAYYLYQPLWTPLWGMATWILLGGMSHLLAAGRRGAGGSFDDALAVVAVSWVTPWLVLGMIPETVFIPLLGLRLPDWAEIVRHSVLPEAWQTALLAFGLRVTHGIGWVRAVAIALLALVVFFAMFLAFMR